jgi:NADH-quinone oxidoreductase subunit L
MTHAFFKALLFLGSGSVIHSMGGEQNIQKMGGLRKWMPITAGTFFVACLAISGFPLFSGFFSKDLILWSALSKAHVFSVPEVLQAGPTINLLTDQTASVIKQHGAIPISGVASGFHWFFFIMGVLTAGLTAFYMFRLYFLTFEGECRADEETKSHLHESPISMTIPLSVLGILSVIGGWLGWPHFIPKGWFGDEKHHAPEALDFMLGFEHWLDEVFYTSEHYRIIERFGHYAFNMEIFATSVSVVVALSGIGAAWWAYLKKPGLPKEIADNVRGLYRLLENKYWVDEIYDRVFVQGLIKVGSFFYAFDKYFLDGFVVNGIGWLAQQIGGILSNLQGGNVQRYVTYIVVAIALIAAAMLYL